MRALQAFLLSLGLLAFYVGANEDDLYSEILDELITYSNYDYSLPPKTGEGEVIGKFNV